MIIPLEWLRMIISCVVDFVGVDNKQMILMSYDVSRAYFYEAVIRLICVKIVDENYESGDEDRCDRLNTSMYDIRDAALNLHQYYKE